MSSRPASRFWCWQSSSASARRSSRNSRKASAARHQASTTRWLSSGGAVAARSGHLRSRHRLRPRFGRAATWRGRSGRHRPAAGGMVLAGGLPQAVRPVSQSREVPPYCPVEPRRFAVVQPPQAGPPQPTAWVRSGNLVRRVSPPALAGRPRCRLRRHLALEACSVESVGKRQIQLLRWRTRGFWRDGRLLDRGHGWQRRRCGCRNRILFPGCRSPAGAADAALTVSPPRHHHGRPCGSLGRQPRRRLLRQSFRK